MARSWLLVQSSYYTFLGSGNYYSLIFLQIALARLTKSLTMIRIEETTWKNYCTCSKF